VNSNRVVILRLSQ